jgi:hypothetical protein
MIVTVQLQPINAPRRAFSRKLKVEFLTANRMRLEPLPVPGITDQARADATIIFKRDDSRARPPAAR